MIAKLEKGTMKQIFNARLSMTPHHIHHNHPPHTLGGTAKNLQQQ